MLRSLLVKSRFHRRNVPGHPHCPSPFPLHRHVYTTKYYDVTVLDVETTGLSAARDRMLEVAAVRVIDGLTVGQFGSLMNPLDLALDNYDSRLRELIPQQVVQLTGINATMIERAPPIDAVLQSLSQFVHGDRTTVMAHNAKFDVGFIEKEFHRAHMRGKATTTVSAEDAMKVRRVTLGDGEKLEYEEHIDTVELAQASGAADPKNPLLGRGGFICTKNLAKRIFPGQPSYSLGSLAEGLGIPHPEGKLHRAMADVQLTIRLWNKIYQVAAKKLGSNPAMDFFRGLSTVPAKEKDIEHFFKKYKATRMTPATVNGQETQ